MKKNKLLNITLLISLFIYIYFAYKNELVPLRYQLILLGIIVLVILLGIKLRKTIVKIIITILVLALAVLHFQFQNILSDVFVNGDSQSESRHATVSIISLKDSEFSEADFKDLVYGTSSDLDPIIYEYIREEIANHYNIVPNIINKNEVIDLTSALLNGEVEVMILDETMRSYVLEHYPGFEEVTQVLETFNKEIILESFAKKVNPIHESFVILLNGADNWGIEGEEERADVNIVAIVNPKIDQILLVSIPRDTYVPLACGNGAYDKLTHAGFYSQQCVVNTIEDFLDLDINYFMKVNFGTMLNVINIIGGSVNVYNPYAFQGHTEEYYFEEGCLNLDALATLNYVRTRYELKDGDFGRQENQKRVIKSLLKKMTSPHRILNMGNMFSALMNEVDTNIDVDFVNKFISNQLDTWPDWQLNSLGISGWDGYEPTYSFPYEELYVYLTDPRHIDELSNNIKIFMNAERLSDVPFLIEEEPETPDPVVPAEPSTPSEPSTPIIYKPTIDDTIQKFGIIINRFELEGEENFTIDQYIQTCELTYGH